MCEKVKPIGSITSNTFLIQRSNWKDFPEMEGYNDVDQNNNPTKKSINKLKGLCSAIAVMLGTNWGLYKITIHHYDDRDLRKLPVLSYCVKAIFGTLVIDEFGLIDQESYEKEIKESHEKESLKGGVEEPRVEFSHVNYDDMLDYYNDAEDLDVNNAANIVILLRTYYVVARLYRGVNDAPAVLRGLLRESFGGDKGYLKHLIDVHETAKVFGLFPESKIEMCNGVLSVVSKFIPEVVDVSFFGSIDDENLNKTKQEYDKFVDTLTKSELLVFPENHVIVYDSIHNKFYISDLTLATKDPNDRLGVMNIKKAKSSSSDEAFLWNWMTSRSEKTKKK